MWLRLFDWFLFWIGNIGFIIYQDVTQISSQNTHKFFVDKMEEIESKKDRLNEYDYLTRMNALVVEKNQSEQKLYYQLTKNILVD